VPALPPRLEDAYFPPRFTGAEPTGAEPTGADEPPAYDIPSITPAQAMELPRTSTVAIWVFALLPIVQFALVWAVYHYLAPTQDWVRWVVLLGPLVIYIALAAGDRRTLYARGHVSVPSAALAIIPPIYLGLRATRLGVRALAPVIVWFALQAAVVFALMIVFPAIFAALTATAGSAAHPS
jgi:hypothetical protein